MGRHKKTETVPAKKADLQLVASNGKFIFCDSRMVAEKFGAQHAKVIRTIERNKNKYGINQGDQRSPSDLIFDPVFVKFEDEYQGQKFTAYRMNRDAFMTIAVRFETDQAIEWQKKFFTAFKQMEKAIANQTNAEWLETRKAGKLTVHVKFDVVKRFVEYATKQGSTKANFYYSNISTMQNKALFFLDQKYKNVRDLLDVEQLWTIASADKIVCKALEDGMARGLHYKEIYQLAKTNVETFAAIHGKSSIPNSQLRLAVSA